MRAAHDRQVILIRTGHRWTVRTALLQTGREGTTVVEAPWALAQIAAQSPLPTDLRCRYPPSGLGEDIVWALQARLVFECVERDQSTQTQARLVLLNGTQFRQASEAYQALVVHHIIFQLPK